MRRGSVTRRVECGALLAGVALLACATPAERYDAAARSLGLTRHAIETPAGSLAIFASRHPGGGRLHVYLEGDGLPLNATREFPPDPTPRTAHALHWMAADDAPAILLGRPCQHGAQPCDPRHWLDARYGEEVVAGLAFALAAWREAHPAREVVLLGYSGGGALAMLLAERVPDVVAVVTVAGNLDVAAWAAHHAYRPLGASYDPAARPPLPPGVLQIHHVGVDDANIPPGITSRAAQRQPGAVVVEHDGADHACCWDAQWPAILADLERRLAARDRSD